MFFSPDLDMEVATWLIFEDWDVTKIRFYLKAIIHYTPKIRITFQSATLNHLLISPSIKHVMLWDCALTKELKQGHVSNRIVWVAR